MSNAFAPIVRARPCPIFGRPVHPGFPPIDYSPILLLKPFGFQITPDTLSSSEISRWPARHYPRLWIQRPSSERRRDFNPPDSCAAQRTLWAGPTSPGRPSSDYGYVLPDAGLYSATSIGRPRDLPVPKQVAFTRARGLRPRRADTVLTITHHAMLPSAFLHSVGTPDEQLFAAQYSAHMHSCQRFTDNLADARA